MGQSFMMVGPSGVGKNTLIKRVKLLHPFEEPVSYTTRVPRDGEVDGVNYHFVSREKFIALRDEGFFAESALVHGNLYGTPLGELIRLSSQDKDTIFDLDIQGAKQLKARFPSFQMIFIMPPSMKDLRDRIVLRNSRESEAEINLRIQNAVLEMREADSADWIIRNGNLDQATSFLFNLISELSRGEQPSLLRFRSPNLIRECARASLS